MRHRVARPKLKRETAPRKALLHSLARSLVLHEHVETTVAKAKAVQPLVEQMVTLGKKHDRQSKRLLTTRTQDKAVIKKLTTELAERFASREGGYTRLRRTGFRKGDGSEMAQLALISK